MWDEALETFRTCQPCVAYDVNNYGYNFDDDANKGSNYGTYTYGYDDDYRYNYYYGGNAQGNDFDCYDDADYTNVNQVRAAASLDLCCIVICVCICPFSRLSPSLRQPTISIENSA